MSIRWIFPVLVAAVTCGCTSLVIYPRDGNLISGTEALVPVPIQLNWPSGGLGMGPIIEVDGKRVPRSALTFTSAGVTATVFLAPGSHWVRARTAQLCWICVGNIGEFDYTSRFFVVSSAAPVSLTVTPTMLARSGSAL
jgi:hypothetical protein